MSHEEKSADGNVPDKWLDTLDKPPVSAWLNNENYPMGTDHSKEDVLTFLKQKKDTTLRQFVTDNEGDEDNLPQSFAHWWLYTRDGRRTNVRNGRAPDGARPVYPTLEKWLIIVQRTLRDRDRVRLRDRVTHGDIFGTFTAWLDLLFVDMSVYDNENRRDGVPRRVQSGVVWESKRKVGTHQVGTRKESMEFIVGEGLEIMLERGWTVGYDWWKKECKHYLVFP